MSQIIITTDDRDFVIFNTELNQVTHYQEQTKALVSPKMRGRGREPFRPFGIALDESTIYIASNDKLGKFNRTSYEFEGLIDIPLYINTHQILKINDTLYVCNTAIDCISIYDLSDQSSAHFNVNLLNTVDLINHPKNANQLDVRHVNTLYEHDNKIYFCRHNKGYVESNIGYFEKDTMQSKILITAGYCCHGIAIRNNYLYTLSTGTGELMEVDLATLEVTKVKLVDPQETFLRGLDLIGDKLVIGGSVNFKNPEAKQEAFLLFFDLKSIEAEKYVLDGIKLINDLKKLE
jgi:hypothetical protein